MNYKSLYSLEKCEFDNAFNNDDADDDFFTSNTDKYSMAPYKNIDDDDEYREFKINIQKGAKGLKNYFEDEQILLCLSYFINSEFYIRYDIHEILLKCKTYNFLIDLININPNNQFPFSFNPSKLKIQIIEESFKIMLFMTSKNSEFATQQFYDLKFIDIFFQNMSYYKKISNASFCRGLNIITNLLHDLPISYDQAEFVTMRYLGKIFQFIDSFNEIDKESIRPVFFLIFAFSTSIPSPEQLKLSIKQKKTSIERANRIHQIAIDLAEKIAVFLENYEYFDSKEATHLFSSLFVICSKFTNLCNNIFKNHMQPFLNILISQNNKSIEVTIDFFRLLNKVGILEAFQFFNWEAILERLDQKSRWILSFVEMIDELRDHFILLWDTNVYQQLIENFDNFSYSIRCKVFYLFYNLIKNMEPLDCLNYFAQNNIFSIFFLLLEDDEDEELIRDILQALKIINSNALILNQIQFVIELYKEHDADFILQNLPPDFTNDLNDIYKAIES